MDNKLQRTLARIFLGIKVLLNIAAIVGVGFGGSTLLENQKLVDHTNEVISEIEIVKNEYQTADYTGRNRNLTGTNGYNLPNLRQSAYDGVQRLKVTVSDNAEQLNNLGLLQIALEKRFQSQDEQYQQLTRQGGTISYPIEVVARGAQYTETIEALFSTLKFNEMNLLRLERQPQLSITQWRIVRGMFVILLINFAITIYLNLKFQKVLSRAIYAGSLIKEAKHDDIDWTRLGDYIQGKREEYLP